MHKLIFISILGWLTFAVSAQTLDDYLLTAAENNPGLKAKYLEYQAALEKVPQVGSLPDPKLTFGYFILPVETRVGAQQAQFSISQMFPWFGSLGVRKDAATLAAKAKFEAFQSDLNLLHYQIKQVYYQLWALDANIRLAEDNLDILKSYEALAKTKYENGKVSMVDVLRVQMQIDQANNDLQVMQQKRTPLLTKFNAILNRPFDEAVSLPTELPEVTDLVDMSTDSLIIQNPMLNELDLMAQSYDQQLRAAKKAGMPNIGLGLNYTIVQNRTDMDVPGNGQDILMPMLTVSLPIYRKKYMAMQNEVDLQLQAIQAKQTNVLNSLTANYQDAIWQYQDASSRIQLYNGLVKTSNSALNILTTSYSSDNTAFEEVLRMQQQILSYEMQLVKAKTNLHITIAYLNYLTAQ